LAAAFVAVAGQAFAQSKPVAESKDGATGAVVRLYRSPAGPRLEVQSASLSLTKELRANGVIVTSLADVRESLQIEVSEAGMVVSGSRGKAKAPAGDRVAAEAARALVASSPLTARAAALIGRMGFGGASPIQPMLLTTRAFLLAATMDGSGMADLMKWMKSTRARTSVISVALPMGMQKPSSVCWKEYGDEVLAAYDDFVVCMKNIKWYDPFFPIQRCEIVYEARIIAASIGWGTCLGWADPS
jgi:hypothetical protein